MNVRKICGWVGDHTPISLMIGICGIVTFFLGNIFHISQLSLFGIAVTATISITWMIGINQGFGD